MADNELTIEVDDLGRVSAPMDEQQELQPEEEEDDEDLPAEGDTVQAELLILPDIPKPPKSGFFIAHSKRHKRRTLHFVGACRRQPGVHFKVFDNCGDMMPDSRDFDGACRMCFPGEDLVLPASPEGVASGDESSSSADSDDESSAGSDGPK